MEFTALTVRERYMQRKINIQKDALDTIISIMYDYNLPLDALRKEIKEVLKKQCDAICELNQEIKNG